MLMTHDPFRLEGLQRRQREHGTTLIELMIAMVVLAIGVGALSVLFVVAAKANATTSKDTSATLLSQKVLEAIAAQHPSVINPIVMTDCAGNQWQVATGNGGAAVNTPSGLGAALIPSNSTTNPGTVDWTQAYAALPPASAGAAGYGMRYVDCAQNGRQTIYEVRWNVMTINAYTRLITVSSRMRGSQNGGPVFTVPVTLRGIGGV